MAEHEESLALLNQDADLISSHLYVNEKIGSAWYMGAAERLGKPLFMGEVGPHFERAGGKFIKADYTDPGVIKDVARKSKDLVNAGVPISLWWAYDCSEGKDLAFKLCYGKTDKALKIIEKSNHQIKKRH